MKDLLKNGDRKLLYLTIGMFIFGLLNIVTASSREAVVNTGESVFYYFNRQLIMLAIGAFLSWIILKFPTKSYYVLGNLAYIITLALVVLIFFTTEEHRGAQNWIDFGLLRFQPSELAKPVIIVCLALIFEKKYRKLKDKTVNHYQIIGQILIIGTIIPIIVFFQRDLGTAFITVAVFGVMFLASPILRSDKLKIISLLVGLIIATGISMYAIKGYILSPPQMARFNFFAPCNNYEKGGYQTCNAFIALNNGGLWGLGIGMSKQKYSYIPEPHTDSVFAIIGEEYGVIKTAFVFIAYIFILVRVLDISSKASTIRGRYIALGVAVYIFMHIFINLGGLFGLIPLTGVPLPFLSYGGTYTICLMCSLAIVQKIQIETKKQKITISN